MKARISAYGSAWVFESSFGTHFVGSFDEANLLSHAYCAHLACMQIQECMDVFKARMGQVHTERKAYAN